MFFLALTAAAAIAHTGQIMAGAAFERFAVQTDRTCPARRLRTITPGDLSWEQEQFEVRLSPRRKARLEAANHADRRCSGLNGLSCPDVETLDAMARADQLRSFGAFACSHRQP